jgi:hypothetical protein
MAAGEWKKAMANRIFLSAAAAFFPLCTAAVIDLQQQQRQQPDFFFQWATYCHPNNNKRRAYDY